MTDLVIPALGIVSPTDRPHQTMIAVVFGAEVLKWSYVAPGHGRSKFTHLDSLDQFTPLELFGIRYGMTSDGRLHYRRFSISVAKTPDGLPRHWQGADEGIIEVMPFVASKVWTAIRIHCGAQQRRERVAS